MNDRFYLHTHNFNPISFLEASCQLNNEQVLSARRSAEGIEIYASNARTGLVGQTKRLWDFVSGRAFDRRRLVHEVMEDVFGQCRVYLGYNMSQSIQERLLTNVFDRDLNGADLKALHSDIMSSISVLPESPSLEELPPILVNKIVDATEKTIGGYRKKISGNKLDSGKVRFILRTITRGLSKGCSRIKLALCANVFEPIARCFSKSEGNEQTPAAAGTTQTGLHLNSETEDKIVRRLSNAWYEILDNDALGPDFLKVRTKLVNSSGSQFQYELIRRVVTRENFEDSGTIRRIFRRAFEQTVERLVPGFEDERQVIHLHGEHYVRCGQKIAENGCSFSYYEHATRKKDPRIMIKSVSNPAATVGKMRVVNAALQGEACYYASAPDIHAGSVAGLPVFTGTVRMQSGGIGLVFSQLNDGVSARDVTNLLVRMKAVKMKEKDGVGMRMLILHDLLTGASFLEDHPFATSVFPATTFNLTNVSIGTDSVARIALYASPSSGSAFLPVREGLRFDGRGGMTDDSAIHGVRIEEVFDEDASGGESSSAVSSIGSYAGGSDTAAAAGGSVGSALVLPLMSSLFTRQEISSDPQLLGLLAATSEGGHLDGHRIREVLEHGAFNRVTSGTAALRRKLGEIIDQKAKYLADVEKEEQDARRKAEKQEQKAARKAITEGPESEHQRQLAKPGKNRVMKWVAGKAINTIGLVVEASAGKYLH